MSKLFVILFVIELYTRINIFRLIRGKHGQEVLKHIRSLEENKSSLMKIEADTSFIKACKAVKLLIKSTNRKLQYKMVRLVMDAKLKN